MYFLSSPQRCYWLKLKISTRFHKVIRSIFKADNSQVSSDLSQFAPDHNILMQKSAKNYLPCPTVLSRSGPKTGRNIRGMRPARLTTATALCPIGLSHFSRDFDGGRGYWQRYKGYRHVKIARTVTVTKGTVD